MFSRATATTNSRKRRKTTHEPSSDTDETMTPTDSSVLVTQKELVQEAASPAIATDANMSALAVAETCSHKKELDILQTDLSSMREAITCRICQRFLAEPYGLACGHTYCYICLDTWLVAQKKNTCPECRAIISEQPVPSLVVRDLVAIFSSRPALIPEGETLEELALNVKEGADMVAKDKAAAPNNQPFKGVFSNVFSGRRRGLRESIFDADDHVHRCPDCFHEVEHGVCSGCGEVFAVNTHDSFDDDDLDLEDFDDDDIFGVHFDPDNLSRQHIRRELFGRHMRGRAARDPSISSASVSDSEDDSAEHDSELDGFVVPDEGDDTCSDSSSEDAESENSSSESGPHGSRIMLSSDSEAADSQDQSDRTMTRSERVAINRVVSPDEPVEISDDEDAPVGRRRRPKATRSRATRRRPIIIDADSDEDDEDDESDAPESVNYVYTAGTTSEHSEQQEHSEDDQDDGDHQDENGLTFNDLIAGRINAGSDSDSVGDQSQTVDW